MNLLISQIILERGEICFPVILSNESVKTREKIKINRFDLSKSDQTKNESAFAIMDTYTCMYMRDKKINCLRATR